MNVLRHGLLAILLVLPALLLAQTPATSPAPAAPAVKLTEIEQLRFQLSQEKQKRIQAQFDAATASCQLQPNTRAILDESDQVNKEMTALIATAFDAHNMDKGKFKLDLATGEFVTAATQ